jgi:glycosyltransferase involved in cell wall biosynthesis
VYKGKSVAVVVPAYNEELLIVRTLDGMPSFVDRIFVVDDASRDATAERIAAIAARDPRVTALTHEENQGLGRSLIDGYLASRAGQYDITAVMAGDNQMDPCDLPALLDPIVGGRCDYVKGNRLLHRDVGSMPRYRYFGNAVLTVLTKFATGYYRLMDPQCGYTAIGRAALSRIPIETMTTRYGYNADILTMLNILQFRVTDVEVRPVYGEEKSKINLRSYIPKTSVLLLRLFLRRIWKRYVVLDFHPLVLFLAFAAVNTLALLLPLTMRLVYMWLHYREFPRTTLLILTSTAMVTMQSLLFALWMDMDHNRER